MTPGTILLVEDDDLLRDALRLFLEDAGYEVVEAASASEALQRSGIQEPSLVVLDLGLPDRPGLEVARELRARPDTGEVPIIALTGRAGSDERRACLEAGCTEYHAKPMQPRDLLQRVAVLLGRD